MPRSDARENRREDRDVLVPILGLSEGRLPSGVFIVSGVWSLPNDITITVRTVLADEQDAMPMALAAVTADPYFRWLPHDADDISRYEHKVPNSVEPWIHEVDHADRRIDRYDPYGSPRALWRPSPEPWVVTALSLLPEDASGRVWRNADDQVMWAEAWGREGGRGDHSWNKSGEWIRIRPSELQTLLERQRKVLVGLIKAQLYIRRKSDRVGGEDNAFTHRSMAFIVDHRLRVRMPIRIPAEVRKAIRNLQRHDRSEFDARLNAARRGILRRAAKP